MLLGGSKSYGRICLVDDVGGILYFGRCLYFFFVLFPVVPKRRFHLVFISSSFLGSHR